MVRFLSRFEENVGWHRETDCGCGGCVSLLIQKQIPAVVRHYSCINQAMKLLDPWVVDGEGLWCS